MSLGRCIALSVRLRKYELSLDSRESKCSMKKGFLSRTHVIYARKVFWKLNTAAKVTTVSKNQVELPGQHLSNFSLFLGLAIPVFYWLYLIYMQSEPPKELIQFSDPYDLFRNFQEPVPVDGGLRPAAYGLSRDNSAQSSCSPPIPYVCSPAATAPGSSLLFVLEG